VTLLAGDLTTPARAAQWFASAPALPSPLLSQLITSATALIYGKLNRARLFSRQLTSTFDGVGTDQIVLPHWPVTSIVSLQMGAAIIQPFPLPPATGPTAGIVPANTFGYGYRFVPWDGGLPGDPTVIQFVNGFFYVGLQNVQIIYQAGYLVSGEAATVPAGAPFQVTVQQPSGIWCRDNGITFADTGATLAPVTGVPATGQYNVPTDTAPGVYTFSSADSGRPVLISYSFVPADLEEACIQLVAERYSYRSRVGELVKSLGGQETIRYLRGAPGTRSVFELPPEVEAMLLPYVSVIPPATGAPV